MKQLNNVNMNSNQHDQKSNICKLCLTVNVHHLSARFTIRLRTNRYTNTAIIIVMTKKSFAALYPDMMIWKTNINNKNNFENNHYNYLKRNKAKHKHKHKKETYGYIHKFCWMQFMFLYCKYLLQTKNRLCFLN